MTRYRNALPQLGGDLFLSDGGIETTLIFLEGLELPDFAAFHLLRTDEGEAALRKYFRTYATLAQRFGAGLILESATWRASADWGTKLGYTSDALAAANRKAIGLLEEIRREFDTPRTRSSSAAASGLAATAMFPTAPCPLPRPRPFIEPRWRRSRAPPRTWRPRSR